MARHFVPVVSSGVINVSAAGRKLPVIYCIFVLRAASSFKDVFLTELAITEKNE